MNLAVNHCAPYTGKCQDCLYALDAHRCANPSGDADTVAGVRKLQETCYPCPHVRLPWITRMFELVKQAQPDDRRDGRLYSMAIVRDPFTHVLSSFFYLRSACADYVAGRVNATDRWVSPWSSSA